MDITCFDATDYNKNTNRNNILKWGLKNDHDARKTLTGLSNFGGEVVRGGYWGFGAHEGDPIVNIGLQWWGCTMAQRGRVGYRGPTTFHFYGRKTQEMEDFVNEMKASHPPPTTGKLWEAIMKIIPNHDHGTPGGPPPRTTGP